MTYSRKLQNTEHNVWLIGQEKKNRARCREADTTARVMSYDPAGLGFPAALSTFLAEIRLSSPSTTPANTNCITHNVRNPAPPPPPPAPPPPLASPRLHPPLRLFPPGPQNALQAHQIHAPLAPVLAAPPTRPRQLPRPSAAPSGPHTTIPRDHAAAKHLDAPPPHLEGASFLHQHGHPDKSRGLRVGEELPAHIFVRE